MKKLNIIKSTCQFLLLSVLVLVLYSTVFSQKNKELNNYKFRTLSEVTMLNREATGDILRKSKLEENHDFIGFDLFYSRVRVEFTGRSRSISSDHKDLIKTWEKLQNVDRKLTSLYESEFLFIECGKEYWIPMQKKVSEIIIKEATSNDMITLFVIHVGGRKAAMSKEYDWLFLSTNFEK